MVVVVDDDDDPPMPCFVAGSKPQYMAKLLQIVEQKLHAGEVDVTLKFTLSALWNLTDESPSTCEMFLSVSLYILCIVSTL